MQWQISVRSICDVITFNALEFATSILSFNAECFVGNAIFEVSRIPIIFSFFEAASQFLERLGLRCFRSFVFNFFNKVIKVIESVRARLFKNSRPSGSSPQPASEVISEQSDDSLFDTAAISRCDSFESLPVSYMPYEAPAGCKIPYYCPPSMVSFYLSEKKAVEESKSRNTAETVNQKSVNKANTSSKPAIDSHVLSEPATESLPISYMPYEAPAGCKLPYYCPPSMVSFYLNEKKSVEDSKNRNVAKKVDQKHVTEAKSSSKSALTSQFSSDINFEPATDSKSLFKLDSLEVACKPAPFPEALSDHSSNTTTYNLKINSVSPKLVFTPASENSAESTFTSEAITKPFSASDITSKYAPSEASSDLFFVSEISSNPPSSPPPPPPSEASSMIAFASEASSKPVQQSEISSESVPFSKHVPFNLSSSSKVSSKLDSPSMPSIPPKLATFPNSQFTQLEEIEHVTVTCESSEAKDVKSEPVITASGLSKFEVSVFKPEYMDNVQVNAFCMHKVDNEMTTRTYLLGSDSCLA